MITKRLKDRSLEFDQLVMPSNKSVHFVNEKIITSQAGNLPTVVL